MCAIPRMGVKLDVPSDGVSWWKLEISWCPSRRVGELSPTPWTNSYPNYCWEGNGKPSLSQPYLGPHGLCRLHKNSERGNPIPLLLMNHPVPRSTLLLWLEPWKLLLKWYILGKGLDLYKRWFSADRRVTNLALVMESHICEQHRLLSHEYSPRFPKARDIIPCVNNHTS